MKKSESPVDCPKVFLMNSDSFQIKRRLDERVEDMVLHEPFPRFFEEVLDFSSDLVSEFGHKDADLSVKTLERNPLVQAIGYVDTLRFMYFHLQLLSHFLEAKSLSRASFEDAL